MNIEIRGITRGSRREFKNRLSFISEKRIRPVIGKVIYGIRNLNAIDEIFEDMRQGKQFNKLAVNTLALHYITLIGSHFSYVLSITSHLPISIFSVAVMAFPDFEKLSESVYL